MAWQRRQAWRHLPLCNEPIDKEAEEELESEDLGAVHVPLLLITSDRSPRILVRADNRQLWTRPD